MTNPYIYADMRHDEDCTDFDAKQDWIEEASITILARFNRELDLDDWIPDIGMDHNDIMAEAIRQQVPFAKVLYDQAYQHVIDEKLWEKLSWS